MGQISLPGPSGIVPEGAVHFVDVRRGGGRIRGGSLYPASVVGGETIGRFDTAELTVEIHSSQCPSLS